MATYYTQRDYSASGRGIAGTVCYKWTDGVMQVVAGEGREVDTTLLMSVGKSQNTDGTLSYYITWLNQMYEGCEFQKDNMYYYDTYLPNISKAQGAGGTSRLNFENMFYSVKSYIYSQITSLINNGATAYSYASNPPKLFFPTERNYLTNSKSGGTTVQIISNNKSNKNTITLSLTIGNIYQANMSPTKRFYQWFNSTDLPTFDPNYMYTDYDRFMQYAEPQVQAEELYPIWTVNGRGGGGLDAFG